MSALWRGIPGGRLTSDGLVDGEKHVLDAEDGHGGGGGGLAGQSGRDDIALENGVK